MFDKLSMMRDLSRAYDALEHVISGKVSDINAPALTKMLQDYNVPIQIGDVTTVIDLIQNDKDLVDASIMDWVKTGGPTRAVERLRAHSSSGQPPGLPAEPSEAWTRCPCGILHIV